MTADSVIIERTFSFKFMAEGQMPSNWPKDVLWGALFIEPASESEVARPFDTSNSNALATAEKRLLWIYLFTSQRGQVLEYPVEDNGGVFSVEKLLIEVDEDAVILMPKYLRDRVEAACKNLEIEVEFHHFEGALHTA